MIFPFPFSEESTDNISNAIQSMSPTSANSTTQFPTVLISKQQLIDNDGYSIQPKDIQWETSTNKKGINKFPNLALKKHTASTNDRHQTSYWAKALPALSYFDPWPPRRRSSSM